jgi:quercetin dioxygenase-like cupin family protein
VETTLEPGDCALLHQNVHRAEGNAGTGPVDFVAVVINPDETQPPANAPEALEVGPMGYIDTGNWAQTGLAPAGPIRLTLRRFTLAPGASLPEQTQVGDALIALREGMLGVTTIDGQPFVQRGVAFDSPEPTPATEGSETTLEAGDAAHVQPGTTITLRNSGDAPARWWLVTAEPVEE